MSRWTDYAENKIADMLRGTAWTLSGSLYIALASAANDSSVTELSGSAYGRQPISRSLAAWAGTQGAGTTTVSTGTSHLTSNNGEIVFPTAGGSWGTASYVVLYDALTSGNPLAYFPITSLPVALGDTPSFDAGDIAFTLGLSGGCSDYLANKLIDLFFRGQAYTWPSITYLALCTAAPSNSSGGTEVASIGGYAREAMGSNTTFWSATNGPGTTSASSGTSGEISNNSAVTFDPPTADWGTITHDKQMDAASAGNMLFYGTLDSSKTVLNGGTPVSYGVSTYKIQIA